MRCAGVDESLLDPRATWQDKAGYDRQVADLAARFRENFEQFRDLVRPEVAAAGP